MFSNTADEEEDRLFLNIAQPFENEIPSKYSETPMQMFVYAVTKFPERLDEKNIIQGANAIQRRQAFERWMGEEGKAVLQLSRDYGGVRRAGKRYQVPVKISSYLEKIVPNILEGPWSFRDATIVQYSDGESQVPHLDPCDATILICLENSASNGDTVFPLIDVSVQNKKGSGVLFFSSHSHRNTMSLHHGGLVNGGGKLVVQLMLDFDGDPKSSWINTVACL